MGRPRLELDEDKIRELLIEGHGSRYIARELGVSRSLIQRIIAGRRFAWKSYGAAPTRRPASHVPPPRPARSESDRRHAQRLLEIGRGDATDEEFAAAVKKLDAILDARPAERASSLSSEVDRELQSTVSKREDAALQATEARESWQKAGESDLEESWETEARAATRGLGDIDYWERRKFDEALGEEKKRAVRLLQRRMKDMPTGASTRLIVDRLVVEGIERFERFVKEAE